ncbi:DUF5133 domain-containing protein [Streptomyces sp. DH12]|uniref:DUF5133 domain-containing protein n=1 Tax=Streptomyces sp. DH12 TaxID=2857010 RepID=UPI001E576A8A|nr:DUF5133 domain-containing protein [Streptomyces sp. DH12]
MLMAHPTVLGKLAEEYESLAAQRAQADGPEVRRRMEDVAYTLCVSTGTRDVEDALAAARRRLAEARGGDSLLAL